MKFTKIIFVSFVLCLAVLSSCSKKGHSKNKKNKMHAVSSSSPLEGKMVDGVRVIKMEINNDEIKPKKFYIKKGDKVKILIKSTQGDHGIEFEKLNIKVDLPEGKEKVIEFNAPNQKAKYNFWCTKHENLKGYMIAKPE